MPAAVDLYKRWLVEVWGRGDERAAAEIMDMGIVDHDPEPGQPAGLEGQLWAVRAIRAAFGDNEFSLDFCFTDGDLVTGRWTMRGTHDGELTLVGIPPTGRPVTMSGLATFRVRDGRFVEVWHVANVGSMLAQLELTPPKAMLRMAARRSARRYRRSR